MGVRHRNILECDSPPGASCVGDEYTEGSGVGLQGQRAGQASGKGGGVDGTDSPAGGWLTAAPLGGDRRAGLGSVGSSKGSHVGLLWLEAWAVSGRRPAAASRAVPDRSPPWSYISFAHSGGTGQSAELRSPFAGLNPGPHTF